MTLAERVTEIVIDCLYDEKEVIDNKPPEDAVIVKGLVRNFAFHPTRVESHKADVAELCSELPKEFHLSNGGGWSFLNLCIDKNGKQWGEQANAEELLALAIATGNGDYCLHFREMWKIMPGGVPYVWLGK